MKEDTLKKIAELGKMSNGQALRDFLEHERDNASDLARIESWEDTLEKRGKTKFIKKILSLMAGEPVEQKEKNPYM